MCTDYVNTSYAPIPEKRKKDTIKTFTIVCTKCSQTVLMGELKNGYSGSCSCGVCFYCSKKCPVIF